MRKVFLSLGLALMTTWAMAQSLYQKNQTTNFYDYIGDPVTTDLVIDFSTITSDKVAYQSGSTTVHAETLIDFQQLGLFKYCYKDKRTCESIEYKPLLWNSGSSLVGGTSTANQNISNNYDFPAIYLPKMKYGIQYIVVEGWGNNNPAALQYMKQLPDSNWVNLGSARTLKKNAFTRDTFMVNDRKIQSIMMHRTSTNNAYQFITKITVKAYPAPQFTYNSTSKRYDYTGTPVEDTLTIDFSKLDAGLACYDTIESKSCHADSLMGFGNVGLYKWCYYATKTIEGTTYAPLLWNNGYSNVGGTRTGNNSASAQLKPAIYLPTMKNGISKIVVEGWTNGDGKNQAIMFIGKNFNKEWKSLKEIDSSIPSNSLTLQGNIYTTDTLEINNRRITDVAFYRSSTEYQYITKITVYPMPAVEPEYVLNNETGRYDYIGDAIEGVYEVNFNELTPYDVVYNTALGSDVFADTVVEFQHMGLYKYGYKDERTCESIVYKPLLWNNGKSDYSGEIKKNNELYNNNLYNKLPCLYFPTIKNGIYQVIIEGWSNKNARGINLIAKNTKGEWGELKDVCPHVDKDDANLGGDTYTTLTFTINSNAVKNIGTWFNSNDWQFITKVKIVPMPDNEVVIDENMDNQALIEQYDKVTVDKLTIYRKLVKDMYNTICLPCEVSVGTFKTAAGLSECEVRWFKDASMSGETLTLDFGTTSTIQARTPYLIKPGADVTGPIVLTNVKIEKAERNIAKPGSGDVLAKYFGTYSPKELNPSLNTLVLSTDNTLYYIENKVTMGGMRGYFVLYNAAAQQQMQCQVRYLPSTTTAIEQTESANTCKKYVIDGRLIIEREGMKYNLQGERIK